MKNSKKISNRISTNKLNKIFSAVMLFSIVSLNLIAFLGCSNKHVIDSPIFHKRPPINQIIIERPPTRIVYSGVVTKEGMIFTDNCLNRIAKDPYKNYKFNKSFNARINVCASSKEDLTHAASYSSNINTKVRR